MSVTEAWGASQIVGRVNVEVTGLATIAALALKKREREKIQPPRRERERKKVGDPTLDVLLAIAVSILRVTIRFVVDTSLREAPTVVTAQTAEIPEVGLALVTFGARHAWLALALSLGRALKLEGT